MTQYAEIAGGYANSGRMEHPQRKHMIYSAWLNECGDVRGKSVLDVGCGAGESSRLLARLGAHVTGIDREPEMIRIAAEKESAEPLGIKYAVIEARNADATGKRFDLVTPTYLLHYAESQVELQDMTEAIHRVIRPGGRMVAINSDPCHPVSRYYPGICSVVDWVDDAWIEGSRISVELQGDAPVNPFMFSFWRKHTYERALFKAGFVDIGWIPPRMNEEGRRLYPNWRQLEDFCITILSARKPEPSCWR